MSYKEKPQLHLYEYKNNSFSQTAIIDDYREVSFERNLYSAGTFTITINYNIPNALLFERGMFIQFGSDPYDFGEILSIRDSIGQDGKGSQIRTIIGYDARYILKRRIIKNLNANGMWKMTAKGELCLRNLIADQCGVNAETKRQLPIINAIPQESDAIGKEYSVSEQFTNLYEVCKTIATQSEIGWRVRFENGNLTLECYSGTDRRDTVQFSTDFDSLRNGEFSDSSESYSNAIYIGGKGQNDERDIYEGEDGTPNGLDRFEAWDDQSQMTTTDEYTAEALSMLTQYGQTVNVSGNGLAKSPYVYKEQYDVGDIITIAFSGKKASVQILSVTERWAWNQYDINFSFGKPQNNLAEQIQLMLRKIQMSSNKGSYIDSVKWYTIPTDTAQSEADVTFDTLGFTGAMTADATFTLYADDEGTGSKIYNVYVKNLSGSHTLTLTTGKAGATSYALQPGTYNAQIYVDENGSIIQRSISAINSVTANSGQAVTSGAVASAVSEIEQKISALQPVDVVASGNMKAVTSNAVASGLSSKLDKTLDFLSPEEVDNLGTEITVCKVKKYPIGWVGNDGIIIHIPWSAKFAYQIALDDQSTWCAVRAKAENVWGEWNRIFAGRRLKPFSFTYTLKSGFSATYIVIEGFFECSGVYSFQIGIENISGGSIGTTDTNLIAQTNILPLANVFAIGFDYETGIAVRLKIDTQGNLFLMESLGITQGNNNIKAVFVYT